MIQIDYTRDQLLTTFGKETLKDRYMMPGEKSPQDAFARAAQAFADDDAHAQRIYDYASTLWLSFATPILSNGGTTRGLPISCFLAAEVQDSRNGLTEHYKEVAWLSSVGGGVGTTWSNIRSDGVKTSKGSVSLGIIPFVKVVDMEVLAFRQGDTRRASYAWYLDISHPEIEEAIISRKPSGGDPNRKCLNLHHGICIPDVFMEAVKKGLDWNLIDPHTKEVVRTVKARDLWQLILETRMQTGEPYLFFSDTVNNAAPQAYKDLGLHIPGSNLCSEIVEAQDENRTAVCCLSSLNLEYYDEWVGHPAFIEDVTRFLDNVITFFIEKAPDELSKAKYSAMRERSLGIGTLGFHAYLQKKGIPFEGPLAKGINNRIFKHIAEKALIATYNLASERGACPDSLECDNYPVRNLHRLAIAPNASSSIICGNTSPSIEPYRANAFTQKTLSGSALAKNKFLEKKLEELGKNDDETWQSIITNSGSVQHLDFLNDWDKDVFKTAIEIDQMWIIEHAADRQKYICQSQSVNLFFLPTVDVRYLHKVHFAAWEKGLKTLYYARSTASKNAENIALKIERVIREESECFACEG